MEERFTPEFNTTDRSFSPDMLSPTVITIPDGTITEAKFSDELQNRAINPIKSLDEFSGTTDEEKIYDALITQSYKGTISAKSIVINNTIMLPKTELRDVRIENAVITLNADMFSTEADYAHIPSFVNCRFVGNGHAIWGGTYVVSGHFIGCSFENCSIICDTNNNAKSIQSPYLNGCTVHNTTVPLIKVWRLYDCHMTNITCESQSASVVDTYGSAWNPGGTLHLWVSDCIFEGFSVPVFKLSGGNIHIDNSYFEANTNGCAVIQRTQNSSNYLIFEITGCYVASSVTAFSLSGFTKADTVNVSVHKNNFSAAANNIAMVSGIANIDDIYAVYDNYISKNSLSNVSVCSDSLPVFDPCTCNQLDINVPTYLSHYSGGWTQFGNLVFIDAKFKCNTAIQTSLSNAIINLPKILRGPYYVKLFNNSGEEIETVINLSGTTGSIRGAMTKDEYYILRCFYMTDNKIMI